MIDALSSLIAGEKLRRGNMRLSVLGIALIATGCAEAPSVDHFSNSNLSLERSQTDFAVQERQINVDVKVSLMNTDFETARRIEHDVQATKRAVAPKVALLELAQRAASHLYPELRFKFLNIRKGHRYTYVTFNQTHFRKEIHGARLVLRMTPQGEWVTMNSTLVDFNLLPPTFIDDVKELSSSDYFSEVHQIVRERSVFLPRKYEDGSLIVHQAREYVVFSLEKHLEYWLWVDELSGEALAAHNPARRFQDIKVLGTIVPNKPDDEPIEVSFPGVTALLQGNRKIEATNKGTFDLKDLMGQLGKISLENAYLTVANGQKADSEFGFDFSAQEASDIKIAEQPSLEERNVYYWIMKAREHLTTHLNYEGMNYQLLAIANFGEDFDNAFFMPLTKSLAFGRGKKFLKNTSLSRDIILHEYGHAVTHSIYGLHVGYEYSAMNEAMSDYLAATITDNPQIAEGALRNSTEMPYLRNIENDMVYPQDFKGKRFHTDGQMFGGALWDLREAIGAEKADKLIHEARLAQAKSIFEFYLELLKIDENLDDHNPFTHSPNHAAIRKAFFGHGIGHFDVVFREIKENLTQPWTNPSLPNGCWAVN